MRRVRECTENTQRTYDILHSELQRCQALRSQNLKTFIEQLRVEISKWWDLTLKSQQERKRFSNYYYKYYNEDLLELHELELDDLKSFYTCNKEIFDLYESRAELWSRMQALEAKANEPNRFNNRGGQFLKEEKERKVLPVGGAQHQRNRVAVPRIRHVLVNHNSVASAANTPSKQAVNQEERPRFGNQLKLPSPRENRMWPNPR
ncbi:protein regulator of cytokinesis 1-like [Drosophila miranda]|uniref:protein regulator of cytokinesis 1-like n=1 Tax=Drosophila miranda TaxID=7229 RepID=UPI00143F118C|nr:protein regulator of cytokinesis 1-like [Drosophila miranda]